MHMNGRFETRFFVTIPLYLMDPVHSALMDLALTENVSPRGLRIVSKRCAEPGESWDIRPLSGGLRIPVRVVYCEKTGRHSFCIGLRLIDPIQQWWNGRREVTGQPDRVRVAGTEITQRRPQRTPLHATELLQKEL